MGLNPGVIIIAAELIAEAPWAVRRTGPKGFLRVPDYAGIILPDLRRLQLRRKGAAATPLTPSKREKESIAGFFIEILGKASVTTVLEKHRKVIHHSLPPQVPHYGWRELTVSKHQMNVISAVLCPIFDSVDIIKGLPMVPSLCPLEKVIQHSANTGKRAGQMIVVERAFIMRSSEAEQSKVEL